jgi:hypothetical protein
VESEDIFLNFLKKYFDTEKGINNKKNEAKTLGLNRYSG